MIEKFWNFNTVHDVRVKVKRKFLFLGLKWMISGKLKNTLFGRNCLLLVLIFGLLTCPRLCNFFWKHSWIESKNLKNDSPSPTLEMSAIFKEYGEHVHNFRVEFYCWSGISPLVVKPKPVRVVKNGEKKLHLCNSLVTTLIFVFLKLFRETLGNAIFLCLRFKFHFELEYTSRITCTFCHYSIFTVMKRILG